MLKTAAYPSIILIHKTGTKIINNNNSLYLLSAHMIGNLSTLHALYHLIISKILQDKHTVDNYFHLIAVNITGLELESVLVPTLTNRRST